MHKKWKDFFLPKRESDSVDKKKLNPLIVWGIILAVALLAGSSIFGSGGKKQEQTAQPEAEKSFHPPQVDKEYIAQMEERLSAALSRIKGAGKVTVIVSTDDEGEKVLATDNKSKSEHQTDENAVSASTEQEESTVMAGQGSSQQPFVVKEKKPNPTGVIVIAEGAGNENVRYELYEAVKALYGISPHRIKVTAAE